MTYMIVAVLAPAPSRDQGPDRGIREQGVPAEVAPAIVGCQR